MRSALWIGGAVALSVGILAACADAGRDARELERAFKAGLAQGQCEAVEALDRGHGDEQWMRTPEMVELLIACADLPRVEVDRPNAPPPPEPLPDLSLPSDFEDDA